VATTWHQSIAEFPALSVGLTYLPIPVGGAITLLLVAERLLIGRPHRPANRRRTDAERAVARWKS
jgi:TRAP-type C4-dicarboxylate transport system permease small subunit